ncbi:hypothetical protein [Streptacidiphilus sp. MAP5-52]|uniref:hypothetical protein n=1 Tax=Streptacidiphilus sp. MAP5-52 TaxID=3156267 RepID=UPI003518E621
MTSDQATYEQQLEQYHHDLEAYQQQLYSAGFGASDRAAYIGGSFEDPEYAALQWDENLLSQAEAAGQIPPRPMEPLSPREELTYEVRDQVHRELFERGYDPFERNLTDEERAWEEARVEELVAQRLAAPEPPTQQVDTDFDFDL